MIKLYATIGLGGTFDHFHAGHKHFLQFAASLADRLKIGLTTDTLTSQKIFSETIQPFSQRKANLTAFLDNQKIPAEIFELEDTFGPTIQPNFVEALAVTQLTQKGGEIINSARKKQQLSELPIHVCDLVRDENGDYISSTRIRQGLINRYGKVYLNSLLSLGQLNIGQKNEFSKKQGPVVSQPTFGTKNRFVVGDIVLETFLKNDWAYNLGIFDGRNQRSLYSSTALEKILPNQKIKNPAGQIFNFLIRKNFF